MLMVVETQWRSLLEELLIELNNHETYLASHSMIKYDKLSIVYPPIGWLASLMFAEIEWRPC
jgi:hypothetical protein